MRHTIAVVVLLVVALTLYAEQPSEEVCKATVKIHNEYEWGKFCKGSGVIVGQHRNYFIVLTCKHVFESRGDITIVYNDNKKREAYYLGESKDCDLAGLATPIIPGVKPVRFAENPPQFDDDVTQAGYTFGQLIKKRSGKVLPWTYVNTKNNQLLFSTNVDASFGDSGSGIYKNGELVGIVTGGPALYDKFLYINCGRLDDIKRFLKEKCFEF